MGLQLARVTRDRKDLFNALAQAYAEIFTPAFPEDDERESLEKIHHLLEGKTPGIEIIVNLAGENLNSDKDRVLKGIAIAYYYREASVGLLGYNAVSPQFLGEGIGKKLVSNRIHELKETAAKQGSSLRAVFIDCNNPEKVPASTDSMDPALRIKLFTSWGARALPFDYVQPPLEKDLNYCDKMILFSYPLDGQYATAQDVSAYINAIYKEALPDEEPGRNLHVRKMRAQLARWAVPNDNIQKQSPALKRIAGYNF